MVSAPCLRPVWAKVSSRWAAQHIIEVPTSSLLFLSLPSQRLPQLDVRRGSGEVATVGAGPQSPLGCSYRVSVGDYGPWPWCLRISTPQSWKLEAAATLLGLIGHRESEVKATEGWNRAMSWILF